jgi:hypothetical protein
MGLRQRSFAAVALVGRRVVISGRVALASIRLIAGNDVLPFERTVIEVAGVCGAIQDERSHGQQHQADNEAA